MVLRCNILIQRIVVPIMLCLRYCVVTSVTWRFIVETHCLPITKRSPRGPKSEHTESWVYIFSSGSNIFLTLTMLIPSRYSSSLFKLRSGTWFPNIMGTKRINPYEGVRLYVGVWSKIQLNLLRFGWLWFSFKNEGPFKGHAHRRTNPFTAAICG